MPEADDGRRPPRISMAARAAGYLVHFFTATGAVVGALMLAAILEDDYRTAFFLMVVASVIDAVDGSLARRFRVRQVCPEIDGRKLDDIVDYLNYTFVPIIMLSRAGWLPEPVWIWAAVPLIASLFGFAHQGAKEEEAGFFRGFPSYWNIVVFYVAVWLQAYGTGVVLAIVVALSLLSVLPVRFVYPTQPPRWMPFFLGAGVVWLALLLVMIWQYPRVSSPLLAISLVYPALYIAFSVYLDGNARRRRAHPSRKRL